MDRVVQVHKRVGERPGVAGPPPPEAFAAHPVEEDQRADGHRERDWRPENGETNPFLHLMMHLSISEQLGIDQPAGIRAAYTALANKHGDEHRAMHETMDCLAEMIWTSQRHGTPPDGAAYIACLEKKAR